MRHEDLGADYYERQRDARRQVAHHVGKQGDRRGSGIVDAAPDLGQHRGSWPACLACDRRRGGHPAQAGRPRHDDPAGRLYSHFCGI